MKRYLLLELLNSYKNGRNSAWRRGIYEYAEEILQSIDNYDLPRSSYNELETILLNGSRNWHAYSYGSKSLTSDKDICERLATKNEQVKRQHGKLKPSPNENWLDCQTRALFQASNLIYNMINYRRV